jgi:hypothetical protein
MFPFAYHIKVIVRDNSAIWLSSGNLNNSNQPDLAAPPHTEDRDWHVIIENNQLAELFAAFLNQDFASAAAHQLGPAEIAATVSDAMAKLAAETNPPPPPRPKPPRQASFPPTSSAISASRSLRCSRPTNCRVIRPKGSI